MAFKQIALLKWRAISWLWNPDFDKHPEIIQAKPCFADTDYGKSKDIDRDLEDAKKEC